MYIEHEHAYLRYSSVAGALLVAFMFFHSAVLDGVWRFGVSSISHLGISKNAAAAALFNAGCILSGVLFAVVGFLKVRTEKGQDCVAGLFLVIAAVFLALVGVVTLDVNDPVHCWVAATFGVTVFVAAIVTMVDDLRNRRWVFAVPIIFCVILIVCFWTRSFAEMEVVAIAVGQVWIVLQAVRHRTVYEAKSGLGLLAPNDA